MRFAEERTLFEEEMDTFYATYPVNVTPLFREMDEVSSCHPEWGPCRRKALIYETAAERCDVQVFRHFPFFYEIVSGRDRRQWGFGGMGSWLLRQPKQRELTEPAAAREKECRERGLSYGGGVLDLDHHCIGYDNVLRLGLNGIIGHTTHCDGSRRPSRFWQRTPSSSGHDLPAVTGIDHRRLIKARFRTESVIASATV